MNEAPIKAFGWDIEVDLKPLCVPVVQCTSVIRDQVDLSVVKELTDRSFDQAVVRDSAGGVIGLAATAALTRLVARGGTVLADGDIDRATIAATAPLGELLELFQGRAAVLVGTAPGEVSGLLTVSDLNRHSFRATFYEPLAELEEALRDLVEMRFRDDPWAWLGQLPHDSQVKILGYWELSRRNNIELSPAMLATLAQLLGIIRANQDLVRRLGHSSADAFRDATGCLPELRNQVMHPVRPLLPTGCKSVPRLRASVEAMLDLAERLTRARKR